MKNKPKQAEELEQQQEPEINKLTNRDKFFLFKNKEAEILNNIKNRILEQLDKHDLIAGQLVTRDNLPNFINSILENDKMQIELYLKNKDKEDIDWEVNNEIDNNIISYAVNLINAANIYRKEITKTQEDVKTVIMNLCNTYGMDFSVSFPDNKMDKIKAIIQLVSYFAQFQDKNDFLIEPILRFKNG